MNNTNGMNKKVSRRNFLRIAALAGGSTAVAGIGLPPLIGEREAIFDPNDSYWALEKTSPSPPLQEDLNVDVAIIGGGYTGLSTAWHLAKDSPGLNIVLLEARQVGHGASGRHGGMVLPQIGVESFEIAGDAETDKQVKKPSVKGKKSHRKRIASPDVAGDLETHKQMYNLTVKGMRSLEKLIKSTGMDCDLRLNGYVHTFLEKEDRDYYEDYVAEVQQAGLPLKLMDEDETAESLGTEIYAGGVYDPNGGAVHAMKMAKALKMAGERAGVRMFGDSPVLNIDEGETVRLLVGNAGRVVRAKAIVLATNAYTSKLGYFKYQVMPVHAQCGVTQPLTARQLESIGWKSRLPFFDSLNMLFHVVLTPDNRIVIGGGSADYCFRNDLHYCGDLAKISNLMLNKLVQMYPALKGIQFNYVWDGVLGMSYDGVPAVGVTGEHRNIYYGLAYNGQGVNLAFVFGEVIAALHQDKDHDWLTTPYANHSLPSIPPEPYRWLGVHGALKYYAWQDSR